MYHKLVYSVTTGSHTVKFNMNFSTVPELTSFVDKIKYLKGYEIISAYTVREEELEKNRRKALVSGFQDLLLEIDHDEEVEWK